MFWPWIKFIDFWTLAERGASKEGGCCAVELCCVLVCATETSQTAKTRLFKSGSWWCFSLPGCLLAASCMEILWLLLIRSQLSAVKWQIHYNSLLREAGQPGKKLAILPSDKGFSGVGGWGTADAYLVCLQFSVVLHSHSQLGNSSSKAVHSWVIKA